MRVTILAWSSLALSVATLGVVAVMAVRLEHALATRGRDGASLAESPLPTARARWPRPVPEPEAAARGAPQGVVRPDLPSAEPPVAEAESAPIERLASELHVAAPQLALLAGKDGELPPATRARLLEVQSQARQLARELALDETRYATIESILVGHVIMRRASSLRLGGQVPGEALERAALASTRTTLELNFGARVASAAERVVAQLPHIDDTQ